MISPTKRAVAGKPQQFSAKAINNVYDAVNEFEAGRFRGGDGPDVEVVPANEILVRNDSGADRTVGEILKITGATGRFPDNLLDANRRPFLIGDTPATVTDLVVILLEPIKSDATNKRFGRAAIDGIAHCTVHVHDTGHKFATPIAGDVTKLASAGTGPIQIVAKETGTGPKKAAVLLQGFGPSGKLLYVSSTTSDSGGWPGTAYTPNGDGTWTTETVRVGLAPNTTGTVFNVGVYHGALLNGSVTVSGTTYPKYWHGGCDKKFIKDCVANVVGYRPWAIPGPWTIGDFVAGSPP